MTDSGLLAHQRQERIAESVRRSGAVRVAELVGRLGVSDMTVRRDLDALERSGVVKKVHGGAVLASGTSMDEPGFEVKSGLESAAKAAVADAAAALVEPGSVVAISAGTTAYAVATRLLRVPRLTVVTNSLPVADLLRGVEEQYGTQVPSLLLTGGAPTRSAALVGPVADLTIQSLHVDLLVLGAHGVSEKAGLTTPNLAESQTNRALIGSARRLVVVADHTKWGVTGLSGFASLSDVDVFVTDDGLGGQARSVLSEAVGELLVAKVPEG
ncbi:DeoR/GlpR family DNA-binding transcription regulator [Streptomyces sp. NPDC001389]|uniref:DeoR/GlpR family DNA-binding transcription regulator n=1 Tax=unclassified Streptomyces TaxID=2593676 RepID=UPI0036838BAC